MRTNNHVERVNRRLRYPEKARYRWRKRKTIVRFVVLLLDRYWKQASEPEPVARRGPTEPRNGHLRKKAAEASCVRR